MKLDMYFDVAEKDRVGYMYPVVMVGDKSLQLDKKLYSVDQAKLFMQGFIVGLSLENAQGFLDLYADRERAREEDESMERDAEDPAGVSDLDR